MGLIMIKVEQMPEGDAPVNHREIAQPRPIVSVTQGRLAGMVGRSGVNRFLGIRYAEAPIGELRWKPPVPARDWEGLYDAGQFGPSCVQPKLPKDSIYVDDPPVMSEDCLSLNIWAQEGVQKAPVMVWIHGGGLLTGFGGSAMYDGDRLAAEGVILVTINYRLGIFGYFAHAGLSAESDDGVSGNYGLLDQIAALNWIQRNIADFGGDPQNVTIFGESAGGLSVMHLMVSPLAEGLFAKAIASSAYMISTPELTTPAHGMPSAEQIGAAVCATLQAPDVTALRAIDADSLCNLANDAGFTPQATIDGCSLKRQLVDSFDRGEQAKVPLIAGFNGGEIRTLRMLAPPVPADAATYEKTIRERYGDLAAAFLDLYPSTDLEESILAALRDGIYGWTAERLVMCQAALGVPSFLYYFDHSYALADAMGISAFHACEIPYVFGNIGPDVALPSSWPAPPSTLREKSLSNAMSNYWVSFARTGSPRPEGEENWQAFEHDAAYMLLRGSPVSANNPIPGAYALHEEVVSRRRANGSLPWLANIGIASEEVPQITLNVSVEEEAQ